MHLVEISAVPEGRRDERVGGARLAPPESADRHQSEPAGEARKLLGDRAMRSTLEELGERWRCARRSALRSVATQGTAEESEEELLVRGLEADSEASTRKVFENSLQLGVGYARFHRTELPLDDVPDAVTSSSSPCAQGTWTQVDGEPALRLERAGCPASRLGPAACDYWREAMSGLVLGVTGGVLHSRHRSVGHGDGACVDVFYLDPESPLHYGPIPDDVAAELEAVVRLARSFDSRVRVEFAGISEGTLYYRATSAAGPGGVSVTSLVERAVRRRLPGLRLQEVSPRPVLEHPQAGT